MVDKTPVNVHNYCSVHNKLEKCGKVCGKVGNKELFVRTKKPSIT